MTFHTLTINVVYMKKLSYALEKFEILKIFVFFKISNFSSAYKIFFIYIPQASTLRVPFAGKLIENYIESTKLIEKI